MFQYTFSLNIDRNCQILQYFRPVLMYPLPIIIPMMTCGLAHFTAASFSSNKCNGLMVDVRYVARTSRIILMLFWRCSWKHIISSLPLKNNLMFTTTFRYDVDHTLERPVKSSIHYAFTFIKIVCICLPPFSAFHLSLIYKFFVACDIMTQKYNNLLYLVTRGHKQPWKVFAQIS